MRNPFKRNKAVVTANEARKNLGLDPIDNHVHAVYDGAEASKPDNLGEPMTTVAFTDEYYPDSSAVDEAFYDENTKTVYVDLHDYIYAYSGVEKNVWDEFKRASSAGSFYATTIKRQYGPGKELGHVRGIKYEEVKVRPASEGVGAPQAFTTPAAQAAPVYHSLNVNATAGASGNATSKYVVTFKAPLGTGDKSHEVQATDEADALRQLNTFAEALGVSLKVRSVTHYFE